MFVKPVEISGWINGNFYTPTKEVIGILPIPNDIRLSSGMAEYIPAIDRKQKHHFLASMQGTQKPVLPIHTLSERNLFRHLLKTEPSFSPQNGEPQWKAAVKIWNAWADKTQDISYKVRASPESCH